MDKQNEPSREGVPAVKIVDLSKRYQWRTRELHLSPGGIKSFVEGKSQETVALDKVSFSVEHGEVFGLLGPNGSGKTTLIKILSNLVIPDSGSVYVEGINLAHRPYAAAAKLQTVLSESIGLEKRLTARQNLMLFASLYNLPKLQAEERIDKLFDYFGLSEVADKTSQSFSTGMSRKLSVARVLLSNASTVVFDEPTSGLDPGAADSFRQLIMEDLVERNGKTIIMATHNLHEARTMCTRIALLSRGKLLAIGSPEEITMAVGEGVEVSLTVANATGPLEDLRGGLSKVDGVTAVDVSDTLEGKRISLHGRKDMGYLDVFSAVSAKGLKVLSVETSSPSLEEAFLRLTRGEDD
ncbi:MAG TPA: ABC transporter ATP-binding protein [Nitrososphaerales archaeon]|nr:ABC transporter ATP-binding protein [Nitrososphaerales archaeon]